MRINKTASSTPSGEGNKRDKEKKIFFFIECFEVVRRMTLNAWSFWKWWMRNKSDAKWRPCACSRHLCSPVCSSTFFACLLYSILFAWRYSFCITKWFLDKYDKWVFSAENLHILFSTEKNKNRRTQTPLCSFSREKKTFVPIRHICTYTPTHTHMLIASVEQRWRMLE